MKNLTENEEDWYRILGMFKVSGGKRKEAFAEKMDWIPRAPRLSSLYGFTQYDHDGRGFLFTEYEKDANIFIVAVKVHVHNSLPERVEFLTGWGLTWRTFGMVESVPVEVKNAAEAYLRDWLGWFGGKKYAERVMAQSKLEWKSVPRDDPVNEETRHYFTH